MKEGILMEGRGGEKNSFIWFDIKGGKIIIILYSLPSPYLISKEMDFNSNIIYCYTLLNMIVRFNKYKDIFRIKKNKLG